MEDDIEWASEDSLSISVHTWGLKFGWNMYLQPLQLCEENKQGSKQTKKMTQTCN
jgi:hypothetical protein